MTASERVEQARARRTDARSSSIKAFSDRRPGQRPIIQPVSQPLRFLTLLLRQSEREREVGSGWLKIRGSIDGSAGGGGGSGTDDRGGILRRGATIAPPREPPARPSFHPSIRRRLHSLRGRRARRRRGRRRRQGAPELRRGKFIDMENYATYSSSERGRAARGISILPPPASEGLLLLLLLLARQSPPCVTTTMMQRPSAPPLCAEGRRRRRRASPPLLPVAQPATIRKSLRVRCS